MHKAPSVNEGMSVPTASKDTKTIYDGMSIMIVAQHMAMEKLYHTHRISVPIAANFIKHSQETSIQ